MLPEFCISMASNTVLPYTASEQPARQVRTAEYAHPILVQALYQNSLIYRVNVNSDKDPRICRRRSNSTIIFRQCFISNRTK